MLPVSEHEVFLEFLWLGWGLYVGLKIPTIANRELRFFGFEVSSAQVSQSVQSFLAGLYQTFALIFPGALVCEAFASEWAYLLENSPSPAEDKQDADYVSLLTSKTSDKLKHVFLLKRASPVFCIALVSSLLLIPLRSIMISIVGINEAFSSEKDDVSIGALTSIGGIDTSSPEGLVRVMQLATRDAYNAEIAHNQLALVRDNVRVCILTQSDVNDEIRETCLPATYSCSEYQRVTSQKTLSATMRMLFSIITSSFSACTHYDDLCRAPPTICRDSLQ